MDKVFEFNGQRDKEEVLAVVNNHPYVLYTPGIKSVLLLTLATAIWIFSGLFEWVKYLLPLAIIIGLFGATIFIGAFYSFKESMLVVTNQRVFNVDQKGFFTRKITELEHQNIQDISSDQKGFAKTVLHYGDLVIRTAGAGSGSEVIISNIPDPYEVQQLIMKVKKGA